MINQMEKTFIRVRSIKDITIFTSLIVLGSVLVALPTGTGVNIAGFFMIFAGIILSLMLKTAYKDEDTGERYMKKEYYFQQAVKSDISAVIGSKPEAIDLTQADKGNALKLDVYYNRKSGRACIQLFEYIPYRYEPCSKVYEHEIAKVEKLIG